MSKIDLIITNSYEEMSQKAADIIIELLKKNRIPFWDWQQEVLL